MALGPNIHRSWNLSFNG